MNNRENYDGFVVIDSSTGEHIHSETTWEFCNEFIFDCIEQNAEVSNWEIRGFYFK